MSVYEEHYLLQASWASTSPVKPSSSCLNVPSSALSKPSDTNCHSNRSLTFRSLPVFQPSTMSSNCLLLNDLRLVTNVAGTIAL